MNPEYSERRDFETVFQGENKRIGMGLGEGAYTRQMVRIAIKEAELWGYSRPRRWLAKYGGFSGVRVVTGYNLEKQYTDQRKRIEALIKPH